MSRCSRTSAASLSYSALGSTSSPAGGRAYASSPRGALQNRPADCAVVEEAVEVRSESEALVVCRAVRKAHAPARAGLHDERVRQALLGRDAHVYLVRGDFRAGATAQ